MFERLNQPLASRKRFSLRVMLTFLAGLILILLALGMGMFGYAYFGHQSLVDAFLNAAMILSGMGPVDTLPDAAAKIFAGCYALFSGLFFIMAISLVYSPIVHRIFHKMHLENVTDRSK